MQKQVITPVIDLLLQKYGISAVSIDAPQKGYRNSSFPVTLMNGERVNVILYKNEGGIERRILNANYVSDFLYQRGFPSRHTVDERIIKLSSPRGERFAALYAFLPGRTIAWEAYSRDHIKLLGWAMSDMHAHLSKFPLATQLPSVVGEYDAVLHRMYRYFENVNVQSALASKLHLSCNINVIENYHQLLGAAGKLPSQQALHMDFVRGNILFGDNNDASGNQFMLKNTALLGVIDFEKTAVGHPIFDIARTLAFLEIDCKSKTPQKIWKYFLHSGYNKRGAHTFDDRYITLLCQLVGLFMLHDFYKFLRHNPYEFLEQNEHFIRTRDSLLKRHIITQLR